MSILDVEAVDALLMPAGYVDMGIRTHDPLPVLPASLGEPTITSARLSDGQCVLDVAASDARIQVQGRTTLTGHEMQLKAENGSINPQEQSALRLWAQMVWLRHVEAVARLCEEAYLVAQDSINARIITDNPLPEMVLAQRLGLDPDVPVRGVENISDITVPGSFDPGLEIGRPYDLAMLGFQVPSGIEKASIIAQPSSNHVVELKVSVPTTSDRLYAVEEDPGAYEQAIKKIYGTDTHMGMGMNALEVTVTLNLPADTPIATLANEIHRIDATLGADRDSGQIWQKIERQLKGPSAIGNQVSVRDYEVHRAFDPESQNLLRYF